MPSPGSPFDRRASGADRDGRSGAVVVGEAILLGIVVMLAGTLPRNAAYAANLRVFNGFPWAVPVMALYLWLFWRYVGGHGPPESTREARRIGLRASRLSGPVWSWALGAGGLAIVALVSALRLMARLVEMPQQQVPDLSQVPAATVLSLILMGAPIAGVVEEAAFRGYMQGPIERRFGLAVAILITGTMFAVSHLDFTWILWPYYVAVAAIYGSVTSLTGSILPAIVLHTGGNIYSNLELWLYGQAEWQASSEPTTLVWRSGPDASFWLTASALLIVGAAAAWAFSRLASVARGTPDL